MLAKGAAIAIQFRELFRDGLYDELAARANSTAMMLAKGIEALGYSFSYPVQTNQIFPVFPVSAAEKLHSLYGFYDWEQRGDSTAVRLITSWATPAAAVEEFLYDLAAL
jgi:threonine aldolase